MIYLVFRVGEWLVFRVGEWLFNRYVSGWLDRSLG